MVRKHRKGVMPAALRRYWALHKRSSSAHKARAKTGGHMVRHRRSRPRGGFSRGQFSGSGAAGIIKNVAIGLAVGFLAKKVGQSKAVGAAAAAASSFAPVPGLKGGTNGALIRGAAAWFESDVEAQVISITGAGGTGGAGSGSGDPW